MYDTYVDTLRAKRFDQSEEASAADQLLTLHDAALAHTPCTFLELGTSQGQSTKVILNALEGTEGHLVSVDIEESSRAGSGPNWTFVQSDSADIENVLDAAPRLRDGIDCLYIDSLHTVPHVKAELYGYFPHVKQGGQIFFDDVDSGPYMRGRRKDSVRKELINRAIYDFVQDVFFGNLDALRLEVKFGSTGLAILTKTAPLGAKLKAHQIQVTQRKTRWFWETLYRLQGKRQYKNDGNDAAGMLIPLNRKDNE
ncbi:MAG: class I SAM-dependent methyltransferase [Paracoccaceae bacterium]